MAKPNLNQKGDTPSKFDLYFGRHTSAFFVFILYLVTLIGLIIIACVFSKDIKPDAIIAGLISSLGLLIGFFAGSKSKEN
jgi:hypothetical protein